MIKSVSTVNRTLHEITAQDHSYSAIAPHTLMEKSILSPEFFTHLPLQDVNMTQDEMKKAAGWAALKYVEKDKIGRAHV